MTTTNKLLSIPSGDISGADLLRVFAQSYGADAAVSMANLATWLTGQITPSELTTQYAAPSATGFSVTVAQGDTWLILTPGAGYAAGAIVLPAGADREEILVVCTQSVAALAVTPASGDTVMGAPASLSANETFRLRFDGTTRVWYKVA